MRKVNTDTMVEDSWSSPKGKFAGAGKQVSEALGRNPSSTDLMERHPFDVEILRIPPGKTPYPYHSHSAQWEFYHVLAGRGVVRHQEKIALMGDFYGLSDFHSAIRISSFIPPHRSTRALRSGSAGAWVSARAIFRYLENSLIRRSDCPPPHTRQDPPSCR